MNHAWAVNFGLSAIVSSSSSFLPQSSSRSQSMAATEARAPSPETTPQHLSPDQHVSFEYITDDITTTTSSNNAEINSGRSASLRVANGSAAGSNVAGAGSLMSEVADGWFAGIVELGILRPFLKRCVSYVQLYSWISRILELRRLFFDWLDHYLALRHWRPSVRVSQILQAIGT